MTAEELAASVDARTVTIPLRLFAELAELVAYPPARPHANTAATLVPWSRILRIRAALEELSIDWRIVHAELRDQRAENMRARS